MSTKVYIPRPKDLQFLPTAPTIEENLDQTWNLEIGPGKGEFILSMAESHPEQNFVAIELKRGRFERIARRAENRELKNLYVILGDARECLYRLFQPKLFQKIYILFPDPWPKNKHAKHRLLKPELIRQLKEFLKPNGEIFCATDAGDYSEEIVSAFEVVGEFEKNRIDSLYPTYFEKKWQAAQRKIDYWNFKKIATLPTLST